MFEQLIAFIQEQYRTRDTIPLHAPVFTGNEKAYLAQCIDSTFVSSVGSFVGQFEDMVAQYTGSPSAVATTNGTAALHMALLLAGVKAGDLVITQPLTFIATCNAIRYCGAQPIFLDVDKHTLGLSPHAMQIWLDEHAFLDSGICKLRKTQQVVRACMPMHTFGHPADIDGLLTVCKSWNLAFVEDAAECLGSYYKGRHTGTFGATGAMSFNGNKIITTGGGGMVLGDHVIGKRAKHLTTTAKLAHPYEFVHDEVGYNYRLPNLNAALGVAQFEKIAHYVSSKRELAERYAGHLQGTDLLFFREPKHCQSNYWLNVVICPDKTTREALLRATNSHKVMTRPIWRLMTSLSMYEQCIRGDLSNALWLEDRVVNLPSSVLPEHMT